jgi:peroxiredoxin Q/BCP
MFKKHYSLSFFIFSFSLLVTHSGFAQSAMLSKGDAAPVFTAQASLAGSGFNFSLKDALAKGPVVVYFYPSAYTGGCDAEAHAFAELKDKFTAAGATIIGVSADDIQRLNKFSSDPSYCAGKFAVASDADGKIAASPCHPERLELKTHSARTLITALSRALLSSSVKTVKL